MTTTMVFGGCVVVAVLAFLIIALVALRLAPGQTPEVLVALTGMIAAISSLVGRRPASGATMAPSRTTQDDNVESILEGSSDDEGQSVGA